MLFNVLLRALQKDISAVQCFVENQKGINAVQCFVENQKGINAVQ